MFLDDGNTSVDNGAESADPAEMGFARWRVGCALVCLVISGSACRSPSAEPRQDPAAVSNPPNTPTAPLPIAPVSAPAPPKAGDAPLGDPPCTPPAGRPAQFQVIGQGPLPPGPAHAAPGRRIEDLDLGAGTSFVWVVQTPRAVLVGVRRHGYCRGAPPNANILRLELPASNQPVELFECPATRCSGRAVP